MFSGGANYHKLKTNLRLAINRLKLLEKKKTELTQKARKEIAEYIGNGKYERAKIRVEHIIREDYLVEALEVVEMYCDLLLARFGLIQQMKELDGGLAEAISSLIWAAPRLQADVAELKVIADQLTAKYGKPYGIACQEQAVATISEKLVHKLGVQAPPKILVEKYLVEIAKNYNVEYQPDPQVMREDECMAADAMLIDFGQDKNNLGGGGGGGNAGPPQPAGFIGYPQLPMPSAKPFDYPAGSKLGPAGGFVLPAAPPSAPPTSLNIPPSMNVPPRFESPSDNKELNTNLELSGVRGKGMYNTAGNTVQPPHDLPPSYTTAMYPDQELFPQDEKPKPAPRGKMSPGAPNLDLPELPTVPTDSFPPDETARGGGPNDSEEIDFDDLNKRFEELKKKK